jgi:transposase
VLIRLAWDHHTPDTTSTYFVGHPRTPLAQRGYSKDRRPDRQLRLLGLLMTRDGLLVGHGVFPGATVDHANGAGTNGSVGLTACGPWA